MNVSATAASGKCAMDWGLLLHGYIGHPISPLQTAAVFSLLAFGMIARWRLGLSRAYERLADELP